MAFNPTASQPGAINNTGDDKALFLKVSTGEMLNAYAQSTQFMDKTRKRTISYGKSAQFKKYGRLADASKYLDQGNSVAQGVVNSAEEVISIDGVLYESLFLAEQDVAFDDVDVRGEYNRLLGESIAVSIDKNIAATGLLASRSTNVVADLPGGDVVNSPNSKTSGDDLFDALFTSRQRLDEKDVNEDAFAYLRPSEYYLLAKTDKIIDKDLNDGNGSFDTGIVKGIAGLTVVKTNNLPSTNITGTINGKYDVDASATTALVMAPSAVGSVMLHDPKMNMSWEDPYLSWLMTAYVMTGHGILRPEAAVEIDTNTP